MKMSKILAFLTACILTAALPLSNMTAYFSASAIDNLYAVNNKLIGNRIRINDIDKASEYISNSITSIDFVIAPSKTEYVQDEKFDLGGAKISVYYEADGKTDEIDVTYDMVSGYDMTKIGKQTVTISYAGKTVSYDIIVNPKAVTGLAMKDSTDNSISFEWDAVSGATGYYIYKYKSSDGSWFECGTTTKTSFIDAILNMDAKYAVATYVTVEGIDYISPKAEVFSPVELSETTVKLDDIVYSGQTQRVAPIVMYSGNVLKEGVDYNITGGTVEFSKCGEYFIDLTGTGNFYGEITVDFKVYCEHKWNNCVCEVCGEYNAKPGDANLDGKVNVRDAAYIASALASGKQDILNVIADFNGDGKINVRDAAAIASALAKGEICF